MNNRGLSLLEVCTIVVVIAILAALLIPSTCGDGPSRGRARCANNLSQIYKLGTVYASMHKGAWPDVAGEELWLSFTKTTPPLIAQEHRDLLRCPVLGEEPGAGTDYLGPKVPFKKLIWSDPLGGDKPGNHGENQDGCVLYKDGRVE